MTFGIEESTRVLAVDPGEKRIGLAISDPTQTIANPYRVLDHVARAVDAASIAAAATELGACRIVVGAALDMEGQPTPSARRANRLAEAIRMQCDLPVEMWDESGSTREAQFARRAMGVVRAQRQGHLDELAATVILQTYLDAHRPAKPDDVHPEGA